MVAAALWQQPPLSVLERARRQQLFDGSSLSVLERARGSNPSQAAQAAWEGNRFASSSGAARQPSLFSTDGLSLHAAGQARRQFSDARKGARSRS